MTIYKDFIIGEMFNIATGRDLIIGNTVAGNVPLISHQNSNNGIVKYISPVPNRRIFDHRKTIALADRGLFYATVQSQNFHIGTRVKALTLNGDIQPKEVLMFLVAAINKLQIQFTEYLANATDKLPSLSIKLPVCVDANGSIIKDDKKTYNKEGLTPDFEYMQKKIAELEQERIAELERYLIATELIDYEINDSEHKILTVHPVMKEFRIIDLFNIDNSHNILKTEVKIGSGSIPYVTASSENNGVMGYIEYDHALIETGNSIFIGGKSMTVSYQESDFFSNDSHNLILTLKNPEKRKKEIQLYMVSTLYKSLAPIYIWNDSISSKKIQKDTFYLPIKIDGNNVPILDKERIYHKDGYIPDFEYMEKYIRAIQKKIIADVVKYKDEVIAHTQNIVCE